jgi:DNA-directed RNA polymerase subunit RPC12/RpoP
MSDQFEKYRETMGKDVVDDFLAKFGLGPKYIPKEPKKYTCPNCKKTNAIVEEEHPDTDMNEMVLSCPDCGFSGENKTYG